MRKFLFGITLAFLVACVSTNRSLVDMPSSGKVSVDPKLKEWVAQGTMTDTTTVPVIVVSEDYEIEYEFLQMSSPGYYLGDITRAQLKILLADPRIKRISSGPKRVTN